MKDRILTEDEIIKTVRCINMRGELCDMPITERLIRTQNAKTTSTICEEIANIKNPLDDSISECIKKIEMEENIDIKDSYSKILSSLKIFSEGFDAGVLTAKNIVKECTK
ncbi:MAG: hypothetical protein WC794_06385 [Candidatus Doudnabacteria bacterium]|jgi:hypothetical protein